MTDPDPPCYCPGCRPKVSAAMPGRCPLCEYPVLIGERITTLTGETWVHDACAGALPGVDPWCAPG